MILSISINKEDPKDFQKKPSIRFHTRSYLQSCPGIEERFLCGLKLVQRKVKVRLSRHIQGAKESSEDW